MNKGTTTCSSCSEKDKLTIEIRETSGKWLYKWFSVWKKLPNCGRNLNFSFMMIPNNRIFSNSLEGFQYSHFYLTKKGQKGVNQLDWQRWFCIILVWFDLVLVGCETNDDISLTFSFILPCHLTLYRRCPCRILYIGEYKNKYYTFDLNPNNILYKYSEKRRRWRIIVSNKNHIIKRFQFDKLSTKHNTHCQ